MVWVRGFINILLVHAAIKKRRTIPLYTNMHQANSLLSSLRHRIEHAVAYKASELPTVVRLHPVDKNMPLLPARQGATRRSQQPTYGLTGSVL
jgi:hypothetical protein